MESLDLVINARWINPVEQDGAVLDQHAIAIKHGIMIGTGRAA